MATVKIQVRIRCRWWLRHYIWGVALYCVMTRRQPDDKKLAYWIGKGIKAELITRH